jgi:hypothetical protein
LETRPYMISSSDLQEPHLLRRLVDKVLSPEELRNYVLLEEVVHTPSRSGGVPPGARGLIPKWKHLEQTAIERVRQELNSLFDVSFFGWRKDSTNREPEELTQETLCGSELFLPENDIQTPDGLYYQSCLAVLRDSVSCTNGIRGVKGKPLFYSHECPPTSWYEEPPRVKAGSPGRPPSRNMKAAYEEAIARIARGEKKDTVALEMAEKYRVSESTLRTYLKPSKTPAWAKNQPPLG